MLSDLGSVEAAPPSGVLGFDTDTQLTGCSAAAFAGAGFRFAIRYLTRDGPESATDLTTAEAEDILNAGLALMAVQHVHSWGWAPNAYLGRQYGGWAATNAQTVGFPPGVSIWLDLEGVASGAPPGDVVRYCNAWYNAVARKGYVPGIYVGADAILDSDQLHQDLKFQYYWKSYSDVPEVSVRGYCMDQAGSANGLVWSGVSYDIDFIQKDNLDNTPFWLVTPPLAATMATGLMRGTDPGAIGIPTAF